MKLHHRLSGSGDIMKMDVPGKKNASVIRLLNKAVLQQHVDLDAGQPVVPAITTTK